MKKEGLAGFLTPTTLDRTDDYELTKYGTLAPRPIGACKREGPGTADFKCVNADTYKVSISMTALHQAQLTLHGTSRLQKTLQFPR